PADRDWIVWTPAGYYAATPNAERLIGWKVARDENKLAAFYPAERFRKRLYQPELIQKVLESGSIEAVLAKPAFKTRSANVEEMMPPRVEVRLEQDAKEKARVTVHVKAESAAKGQPVSMLRLLVNGRPLPDGQGVEKLAKAQDKVSRTWTIPELPAGTA